MKKHKLGLSTRTFIILISLSAVFLLVTVLIEVARAKHEKTEVEAIRREPVVKQVNTAAVTVPGHDEHHAQRIQQPEAIIHSFVCFFHPDPPAP